MKKPIVSLRIKMRFHTASKAHAIVRVARELEEIAAYLRGATPTLSIHRLPMDGDLLEFHGSYIGEYDFQIRGLPEEEEEN